VKAGAGVQNKISPAKNRINPKHSSAMNR